MDVEQDIATGASTDSRAGFHRALERIEAGGADSLVVTKLDRLARSSLDFATTVCRAEDKCWSLVILEPALGTSTPMGRARPRWRRRSPSSSEW